MDDADLFRNVDVDVDLDGVTDADDDSV